ncbi:hypothetical protein [Spiroplasma clarkii]|nr:hypothetical protein [Spiroplasma clarkii]
MIGIISTAYFTVKDRLGVKTVKNIDEEIWLSNMLNTEENSSLSQQ